MVSAFFPLYHYIEMGDRHFDSFVNFSLWIVFFFSFLKFKNLELSIRNRYIVNSQNYKTKLYQEIVVTALESRVQSWNFVQILSCQEIGLGNRECLKVLNDN